MTDLDLTSHDAQAAYLSDALTTDDPALVVLALKEIGTLRRIPVALDENPPLGEVLRTARALGFDLGGLHPDRFRGLAASCPVPP